MNVFTVQIDPREIKLLQHNARYMKHEDYNRLVQNIRKDGHLTSTPFLCRDNDGRWLVLSGNHRVKASIDAGLKIITCLATEDELSNDSKIAIQLSHNALVGQDDIATLKQLYEEIDSTDYKKYSGLDDKTLGILEKVGTFSISEAHLDFRTLAMTFLPDDIEEVKRLFDEVKEKTKTADTMLVARMHEWDAWLDTQEMISSAYNVKNVATSVQIMLQLVKRNIYQLSEAWQNEENDKQWIPVETCIGRGKIPTGVAKPLKKALSKIAGTEGYADKDLWKGLKTMAQFYIENYKK